MVATTIAVVMMMTTIKTGGAEVGDTVIETATGKGEDVKGRATIIVAGGEIKQDTIEDIGKDRCQKIQVTDKRLL